MGAHSFSLTARGTDVHDAYRRACDDALYESGHDSYNGTISTTSHAVEFARPKGVATKTFWMIISEAQNWSYYQQELDDRWSDAKQRARARKSINAIPKQHRDLIERMSSTIEKWGACVAIELPAAEARKAKASAGRQGTRDKVYAFAGTAAS